ncbi:virulence factor Mce family protein [Gordonia humi]|uniref:Phospholipid/cholesterol/gamma-HCH transport system substrate-binding protein n=1 Tax=Gordonia humi TaxID=686429 RepID=A0A840EZT1_9ACTN|nr:phospholipid/cholesterol/gamma-HCH transport system substrate-binding protein [Gordonia humi]
MSDEQTPDRRTARSKASVGVIGVLVTAMLVISALQMDRLPFLSQVSTYDVYFEDAGGLVPGDVVIIAGIEVGKVEKISLAQTDDGMQARIGFRLNDTVELGDRTRASIKTETVLGRRNLTLTPIGDARMKPGGSIPVDATESPYSLSDALDDATSTLERTDTDQLNKALSTMTDAFEKTPDNVRGAVEGVGRVSKAIADRDNALNDLLKQARGVSDVVAERSQQIRQMLIDANALLGELQMRREAIRQLISGTRDVAAEITGFIQDNQEQLRPVLEKFNGVLDILNDNEDNFSKAIDNLGPYANTLGEAVSSGPYFSSLVGLPTFGDYMGTFLKVLQRKYPEAAKYFYDFSGFPLLPKNWNQGPDSDAPDLPDEQPKRAYPTPIPQKTQTPAPTTSKGGR